MVGIDEASAILKASL
ncbi:unnamed protein product [Victoria cruziana]